MSGPERFVGMSLALLIAATGFVVGYMVGLDHRSEEERCVRFLEARIGKPFEVGGKETTVAQMALALCRPQARE